MGYRKLRIAWSVAWGVATLLLLVLWVRSYWRGDCITRRGLNRLIGVESNVGRLAVFRVSDRYGPVEFDWSFEVERPDSYVSTRATFYAWSNPNNAIVVPHWFAILPLAGLAAFPWLRWRFSLRTLLIATTLVAILLGLIVYYPESYRWWPEKDQKFWRSPQ